MAKSLYTAGDDTLGGVCHEYRLQIVQSTNYSAVYVHYQTRYGLVHAVTGSEKRVMRLALPVSVIREMDAVILDGVGGYSTRAEFILDAIQERLVDLTVTQEVGAGVPDATVAASTVDDSGPADGRDRSDEVDEEARSTTAGIDATRIMSPARGSSIEEPTIPPAGEPLFGLHNRDYPSIWALEQLAHITGERPAPLDGVLEELSARAWEFGGTLRALEEISGDRLTGLFPTNPAKRKSAETAFRSFAVGEIRTDGGGVVAAGPLFEWNAAGVARRDGVLVIGMTDAGWDLLANLSGITAGIPHPEQPGQAFLAHLARWAPGDLSGFIEVLRAVGGAGCTRTDLLHRFREVWPQWSDNEISTNAAGYVARAREWGLLEPKQTAGRYHVTEVGADQLHHHLKEITR